MNILTKASSLLFVSTLFLLSACMEPDTPEGTADFFWKAMVKRNTEAAQNLSTDGSAAQLLDKLKPQTFELGRSDTNGNRVVIETRLTQLDGMASNEVLLSTVLFYHNDKWRVSIKQTQSSLLPGALKKLFRNLEGFGSELGDKLGASLNGTIEEALPVIEEALQQGIEQLEGGIDFTPHSEPKTTPKKLSEKEII
ncbi:MAG: hypothetical protein KUG83_06200 [Gammaproteobacteria bacterium]|nr:hypothetical protein [Gammaproteobacteria bacterium]